MFLGTGKLNLSQLKPPKNRAGNRTYRQKDIEVILNIKDLLYKKKFTIDGARVVLQGKDKIASEAKDSIQYPIIKKWF